MQITSFVLKIIAIICMLIDHASVALDPFIPNEWYDLYKIGRMIGRTAFPLFCFMIVEGFYHTRNKWKYLLSLLLLAFISELPFDAIITARGLKLEYQSQNVFFTLFFGLLTIILVSSINKYMKGLIERVKNTVFRFVLIAANVVIQLLAIELMAIPVDRISPDYRVKGLYLILIIYYFEKIPVLFNKISESFARDKAKFVFAGLAILLWLIYHDYEYRQINEIMGFPAVILVMLYNGKRGNYKIPKYVFYFFYPAHLLILYFIRQVLGDYFNLNIW